MSRCLILKIRNSSLCVTLVDVYYYLILLLSTNLCVRLAPVDRFVVIMIWFASQGKGREDVLLYTCAYPDVGQTFRLAGNALFTPLDVIYCTELARRNQSNLSVAKGIFVKKNKNKNKEQHSRKLNR